MYASIANADTDKHHLGYIPTPNIKKEAYWGSHCILIIGYDDNTQKLTLRNSWGKSWGDHTGNYTMSYSYVWDNTVDPNVENITPIAGLWVIDDYS